MKNSSHVFFYKCKCNVMLLYDHVMMMLNEPRHVIYNKCGILTSVDSDEPMQPSFKLRTSK